MNLAFGLSTIPVLRFQPCFTATAPRRPRSYQWRCNLEEDVQFTSWCRSRGVTMPNLSIRKNNDGRALYATADIEPDSQVLSVPSSLLISVRSDMYADPPIFRHLSLRDDSYFWERASWEVRLGVVLLDHVRAGDASPFAGYIQALPERPGSILVALADRELVDMAREQLVRLNLIDVADSYAAHIIGQHEAFNDALTVNENTKAVSVTEFCWAVAIAQSRAFGVPPANPEIEEPTEFALFPGLDCGNHSALVRSELKYNNERDMYSVSIEKSGVSLGDECFLNYGRRTSAQLALFYGFVEGGSPHASITIGSEVVWEIQEAVDPLNNRKQAVLDRADLAHDDDEFVISLHEVDVRLMQALRVSVANEMEIGQVEENEQLSTEPFSLDNEVRAWNALLKHLEWKKLRIKDEWEIEFRENLELKRPFSVPCEWGMVDNAKAVALFTFERNRVVDVTMRRIQQFSDMSSRLGRLIDPNILKKAAGSVFRKPTASSLGGVRVF